MPEDDVNSILKNTSPGGWTPTEVERIKEHFHQQRPVISALLARSLWQYWRRHHRDQPLFELDEDNIALLLHARAFGEDVPEPGDSSFFGQYLYKHRKLYGAPPKLSRLNWGPRSVLAREVLAGLDSPVMHAWVFVEDTKLQQILIVGEGLPEIRQQIVQVAFQTSLQVHGVAHDIMNIGVLRIELPGSEVTPWDIPFPIIGDLRQPLSPAAAQTAVIALEELLAYLKALEQNSGLVRIHQVQFGAQKTLALALREKASNAFNSPHRATLWKSNGQASSDLVTLIPYLQITQRARPLNLEFNLDLLETATYKRLLEAYHYATIQRILMDVGVRRDYFKHEAERMEAEEKYFKEATPPERIAVWGKTILITQRFDAELGVAIKLAEPEEMPIELFFEHNIPELIRSYRSWQRRMERIIDSVQEAFKRDDAPVDRFAASRFLDAAMRGRSPDESRATQTAFEGWCKLVQPLLRFEWHCFLQGQGIDEERVFTHHTFFHTQFTARDRLLMSPFTLFDRDRSVALFDMERHVIEVRDATDYARDFEQSASQATELPDQLWQGLRALAGRDSISEEEFASALRKNLQHAPLEITERILKTLIASHLAEQIVFASEEEDEEELTQQAGSSSGSKAVESFVIGGSERKELETHLATAREKTRVSHAIMRAFMALRVTAFQTAREALSLSVNDRELQARVYIVHAIVECVAENRPFGNELPAIYHRPHLFPHSATQSALNLARAAHEVYVSNWITQVENEETRNRAIAQLLHGLPQAGIVCSPAEYAALLARTASESARLARELEQAAATLAEDREIVSAAFAKLGWVLEDILLPEFGGAPQDELLNLIEVLSGETFPQYPGMGGSHA